MKSISDDTNAMAPEGGTMKILTAMFRARDDGTVTSHYRAQHMTGDDVPKLLRAIRADIDTELALIENCPAVRTKATR